jgi:hypothetical protein
LLAFFLFCKHSYALSFIVSIIAIYRPSKNSWPSSMSTKSTLLISFLILNKSRCISSRSDLHSNPFWS